MTNEEIYKWLKEQNYQTEQGEQEYTMYFDVDMPKILTAFVQEHNARLLSQAGVPDAAVIVSDFIEEKNTLSFDAGHLISLAKELRSRMSALLLKEREEKDREMEAFAEWKEKNFGHLIFMDGLWRSGSHPSAPEIYTTSQLLAKFRERNT